MWKMEKFDYCLHKAKLDLEFLCKCNDNNVFPKFLNFRVANNLLSKEICQKKSTLQNLQKEFSSLKASLQN